MKKVVMPEIRMPIADVNTHEFTLQNLDILNKLVAFHTDTLVLLARNAKSQRNINSVMLFCLGAGAYLFYEYSNDIKELKEAVKNIKNH